MTNEKIIRPTDEQVILAMQGRFAPQHFSVGNVLWAREMLGDTDMAPPEYITIKDIVVLFFACYELLTKAKREEMKDVKRIIELVKNAL